jgi:hypothetical protein
MRTTLDLPDDLLRVARVIARDEDHTLSETVAGLLRRALGHADGPTVQTDEATGPPRVRIGRTTTSEDVRALEGRAVTVLRDGNALVALAVEDHVDHGRITRWCFASERIVEAACPA